MSRPRASKTDRGFGLIDFTDAYGEACSIQESSIDPLGSHLWLGQNDPTIHRNGANLCRMHLSRRDARWLVGKLQNWLRTGDIK